MNEVLFPVGYVILALAAGRVTFILMDKDGIPKDDAGFFAVLVTILFPVALLIGTITTVIYCLYWIVSRPTIYQHRREAAEIAKRADEAMKDDKDL